MKIIEFKDGKFFFNFEDDEGNEASIEIAGGWEVCGRCRGNGKHVNPAIDGNGITPEEMSELGDEFYESYMGGLYDVTCYECSGRTTVKAIKWDVIEANNPKLAEQIQNALQEEADYEAMCAAERAMGA